MATRKALWEARVVRGKPVYLYSLHFYIHSEFVCVKVWQYTFSQVCGCVCEVACRRALCVCFSHSALGMMVKGRMGLLASSSKAVRKHSVAAAVFP